MEVKTKQWTCKRVACTFTTNSEEEWDSHINNHDILPDMQDTAFQLRNGDQSQAANTISNHELSDYEGESGTAYVCPKCGRLCSDKDSVELHTQTCGQSDVESTGHTETGVSRRTYRCQICHERFSWHGNLTRHLEEKHKIIKKRSSVVAGKAQWECDKCNYKAMYGSELERHKRLHKNIKPFACIFCEYNSSWKSDLKRHYEGHHKDKLGDEKLNDIMTRYKNNAGTHLETQTMDREKIASIVLNSSSNDSYKGHDFKTMNFHGTSNPSRSLSRNSSVSDQAQDKLERSTKSLTDMDLAHCIRCKECNFTCQYEWDLQKHFAQEHSRIDDDFMPDRRTSYSEDNPGCQLSSENKFSGYRSSCGNSEESDSPIAMKDEIRGNPMQAFKSNASMNPTTASYSSVDSIANSMPSLTPYDGNSRPPYIEFSNLPLPGAAAFVSMMGQLTMMGQMAPVQMYSAIKPSLLKSVSNETSTHPPPPPLTAAPRPSPPNSPTIMDIGNCSPTTGRDSTEEDSLGSLSTRGRRRGPNKSANERNHRRFKCSQCAHRSNWKWDINKHIKVAHPGAKGARLIVLSEEEAVATLQQYLAESGGKKRSGREREGYYRPFKCSECGKRSNWEWDTNNHIKKSHNGLGQVVKLSYEESVRTIEEYMNSKKHPSEIVASKDPSFRSSPRKDALNLKRFKCNECGYRSNYRSDIKRHINRKHKNNGKVIILTELEARDSLKSYVDNFPQRSNALFKKSIPPELLSFIPDKNSDSITNRIESDKLNDEYSFKCYSDAGMDDGKQKLSNFEGQSSKICSRTKVWTCRICEIPFRSTNKPEVFKHIAKVHPNDKPFVCDACGVGSDYRNSLIRHIRTKHRELLRQSAASDLCCTNVDHFKDEESLDQLDNERVTSPDNDSEDFCTSEIDSHKKKLIIEMVQPEMVMVDSDTQDAAIDYSLPKAHSNSSIDAIDLSVKDSPPQKSSEDDNSFINSISLAKELRNSQWNSVEDLSNRDWHCIKYKLNKVPNGLPPPTSPSSPKHVNATHQIYRCRHCSLFSFKRKTFIRRQRSRLTNAAVKRRSEMRKCEMKVAESTEKKGYVCQICPFRANDIDSYIQHVSHHNQHVAFGEFRIKCDFCGFFAENEPEMAHHRKLHFQC